MVRIGDLGLLLWIVSPHSSMPCWNHDVLPKDTSHLAEGTESQRSRGAAELWAGFEQKPKSRWLLSKWHSYALGYQHVQILFSTGQVMLISILTVKHKPLMNHTQYCIFSGHHYQSVKIMATIHCKYTKRHNIDTHLCALFNTCWYIQIDSKNNYQVVQFSAMDLGKYLHICSSNTVDYLSCKL